MTCPKCGAVMNHQAAKLVQPVSESEAAQTTATFDGMIEDVFACPECGWIESRRTSPPVSRS